MAHANVQVVSIAALSSDRLRRPGLLGVFAADLLTTFTALLVADHLRFTLGWGAELGSLDTFATSPLMVLFGLVWSMTAFRAGLYERPRIWRWRDCYRRALVAGIIADSIIAALLYLSFRDLSRLLFVYYVVAHLVGLFLVRAALWSVSYLHGEPFLGKARVVLVGSGDHAERVVTTLDRESAGVELVARLATPSRPDGGEALLTELSNVIKKQGPDEVLFADPKIRREDLLHWVIQLRRYPVHVALVPDLSELVTAHASIDDVGGTPVIALHEPVIRGSSWVAKRCFDVVVSSFLLALAMPVMAIVGLAIWLESGRPILFAQERVGLGGARFGMFKFRTMDVDAEDRAAEVSRRAADGRLIHKQPDDPRVTRLGRVLRRFGIDELPQFLHVLSGTMSLVGPRPELPEIVAEYEPWQYRRFAVPPGITGWWQVNRDHGTPMHFQTDLDIYYLTNYSFFLDLRILFRTFAVLFAGRGAY